MFAVDVPQSDVDVATDAIHRLQRQTATQVLYVCLARRQTEAVSAQNRKQDYYIS